jgi:long-chain acyl-CoA synthetase
MGLNDFTFYDLVCRNAGAYSSFPAWYEADDGRSLTFGQFRETVDRLAGGLQAIGIRKGDRIGILGKNSLEYFLLYGAAAALGAVVLPINWRLSTDEILYILKDGEPVLLFVDEEFEAMIRTSKEKLTFVKHCYNLRVNQGGFEDISRLLDTTGNFAPAEVSSDDGFVIIHTAAVAGSPRGALLSHRNMLCANLALNYCFHSTYKDVHLNLLPLFHVGGLFMASSSFHAGAQNINMRKFDADQAVALIETHRVSLLFDFSPILSAILETQAKTGAYIGSLRAVMGIDAPETIEAYQKRTGGTFYCLYGQTETSCIATMGRYDDKPGSAGKAVPLADVRLVDAYDQPVVEGAVGEIIVKGPMVFKGYWNLPEDNAYAFREGWHHTGDLGRFDAQGFLWYAGRKAEKELIKPGGENVYPAEVEKVILQHPAVEKTVVIGVPDSKWKEGIKAVCQLKPGQTVSSEALIQFVGERIARFKKPQVVEFVAELPLKEDGGIDRQKVKELYGNS